MAGGCLELTDPGGASGGHLDLGRAQTVYEMLGKKRWIYQHSSLSTSASMRVWNPQCSINSTSFDFFTKVHRNDENKKQHEEPVSGECWDESQAALKVHKDANTPRESAVAHWLETDVIIQWSFVFLYSTTWFCVYGKGTSCTWTWHGQPFYLLFGARVTVQYDQLDFIDQLLPSSTHTHPSELKSSYPVWRVQTLTHVKVISDWIDNMGLSRFG